MRLNPSRSVLASLIAVTAALGCTLPGFAAGPDIAATSVVGTLFALQTIASASQTALPALAPPVAAPPLPGATHAPGPTQTPEQPVVSQTGLCWTGPGGAYPVVSSIKAGTQVVLLGIGSQPGWYIIENPKYHDRCWIESKNLRVDPGLDLAQLRVFNPPPTPGPTPGPTATP